jgi:hypothetical protein
MSDEKPPLPLTFSQAQGLEPLPSPLALGEVSQTFRVDLWNWFLDRVLVVQGLLGGLHTKFFRQPRDTFDLDAAKSDLRRGILGAWKYNHLFDVLQFVLRQNGCPPAWIIEAKDLFRSNLLAYDLLYILPDGPTIVPNASPEEGEAIRQAFANLATGPFDGARHHLQQAAVFINAGDAPKAVAQTMHAVESVVRVIAPNNNFKQALTALSAKTAMHPALYIALDKLYGYTSDEKGIRHPLLESDVAKVHMPEAVFMYGACASFITYLISRARESGLLAR